MTLVNPRRFGRRKRIRPGWTNNPVGFAICDRCGLPCMYDDLRPDMQFRGGMAPVATGLMVCGNCEDVPNAYFQKQVLRPDPVPLKNPRPDDNGESDPLQMEMGHGDEVLEGLNDLIGVDVSQPPYPTYQTGDLPNPYDFPAGFQINVLGLWDSPVRAYANTINWRRVDTNAVIT